MPLNSDVILFVALGVIGVAGVGAWAYVQRLRLLHQPAPRATAGVETRLARIETAVEAMALEVERMSEAQRYSARMLAAQAEAVDAPALPPAARRQG